MVQEKGIRKAIPFEELVDNIRNTPKSTHKTRYREDVFVSERDASDAYIGGLLAGIFIACIAVSIACYLVWQKIGEAEAQPGVIHIKSEQLQIHQAKRGKGHALS